VVNQGEVEPTDIPARRLTASTHLTRAARSQLASETEHYHVMASIAESLVLIRDDLHTLTRTLHEMSRK
jgi:hypothetical protein